MSKRCVVALVFCLFILTTGNAQKPPWVGQWTGELTQEQGGYLDTYRFEIYIREKAGQYEGRTYVRAPGVLGQLSFVGEKRGAILYIVEKELLLSRKPLDLSWCFKTMQLRMVQREGDWYLEGPWQGTSDYGVCIPGWLSLKRTVPKV